MKTLVIAPHPDDELQGLGGTLLRRRAEGTELAWLIVTGISEAKGWKREQVERRAEEIARLTAVFGSDHLFTFDSPTTQIDRIPVGGLVGAISSVIKAFQPKEVFALNPLDLQTDHRAAFDAAETCTKSFQNPSVKRVLAYETLSETDFGLRTEFGFRLNVFVDIAPFLEGELKEWIFTAWKRRRFRSRSATRRLGHWPKCMAQRRATMPPRHFSYCGKKS